MVLTLVSFSIRRRSSVGQRVWQRRGRRLSLSSTRLRRSRLAIPHRHPFRRPCSRLSFRRCILCHACMQCHADYPRGFTVYPSGLRLLILFCSAHPRCFRCCNASHVLRMPIGPTSALDVALKVLTSAHFDYPLLFGTLQCLSPAHLPRRMQQTPRCTLSTKTELTVRPSIRQTDLSGFIPFFGRICVHPHSAA